MEERENELVQYIYMTQYYSVRPPIILSDGTKVVIQASKDFSCFPKEDYLEEYKSLEFRTSDKNVLRELEEITQTSMTAQDANIDVLRNCISFFKYRSATNINR